jgi:signal transduction histidine kinase
MGDGRAKLTMRAGLAAAIAASAVLTLLALTSVLPAAVRNPGLHVAIETAATVITALVALLVYGRLARSRQTGDLLLVTALAVFVAGNLGFSAIPAIASGVPAPLAWGGVPGRSLGAALLAAAAFLPAGRLRRPRRAARLCLGGCMLVLAGVSAAAALGGDTLPAVLGPGSTPRDAFAAHWIITTSEAVLAVLFAAAAIGFARRADRDHDGLLAWLAIGAVFAAFARLNYTIYPSVLTDWFAIGDILRLTGFVCVLAGGAAEIRRTHRALAAAAVDRERHRIARDLHDGTAQDVAFIVQMSRRLAERDGASAAIEHIINAAEHALGHTRAAVANLGSPSDESLLSALRRTAEEVAGREGVRAEVTGADPHVSPATREALCLLVREAVTNAIRHGGAETIRVTIDDGPGLTLRIDDDGCGFDPEQARGAIGCFGFAGMDRRVAELGGELHLSSRPGAGTELLVVLP